MFSVPLFDAVYNTADYTEDTQIYSIAFFLNSAYITVTLEGVSEHVLTLFYSIEFM